MTTLVFGGTGFIGRRTVPRLVEAGERVVVMDINPATADYSALGDSVRVLGGDVTNFEDVVKAVMDAQPDRIINLAYMIGGGENTPHFSFRLDLLGMDNCFEAARLCGVNRVVYASSFAVSGLQRHFGDRALNEDDPAYGSNIYAMNKRYNEFQAAQFNRTYGMNIIGIRPPMVTGYDKERGSMAHVRMVTLPAQGLPVSFPESGLMQIPSTSTTSPRPSRASPWPRRPGTPSTTPAAPPSASPTLRTSCASSSPTPTSPSKATAASRTPPTTSSTTAAS